MPGKFINLGDVKDYDTAIKETGYGRFHYEILAVSAMSILCMGFQNGLSSYVFPAAQCDLSFTSFELGIINMAFMIGGVASCFLWGALADNLGRRKILVVTHLLDAIITLVCSLLPTTANLLVCRFLNGFLIGIYGLSGPGSIIFTYVAEFQPPKLRTPVVCGCGIFFTLSWLLLPLLAYFILPLQGVTWDLGGVIFFSPWRLFLVILAVPELLTALWILKMPESPKFLLAKGSHAKSLLILRKIYALNSGREQDSFPVKNLIADAKPTPGSSKVVCQSKTMRVLKVMKEQMRSLFQPPLLLVTALTCAVMFANMFGMFGLGLWLPEIFVRFDQFEKLHPNATPSITELSGIVQVKNASCETTFDASVTFNTVVISSSSLVFNLVCSILAMKLHFKVIPLITMLMGGATSVSIYFLTSSLQNLVVASLFQASMITANITIGSIAVELFPTKVVGLALCFIMCAGRFGAMASSFLFGYFMDSQCEIPIFVVGVVVLLGGLLCFLVPRKAKGHTTARSLSLTSGIEVATLSGYDVKFR
ncbi:hypothetical protein YQE_08167, partial [Dendroctonus ponderosae]